MEGNSSPFSRSATGAAAAASATASSRPAEISEASRTDAAAQAAAEVLHNGHLNSLKRLLTRPREGLAAMWSPPYDIDPAKRRLSSRLRSLAV